MRIKITSTVFLLVAVLLLVSPAFSQETGMDPIDNNELDDEEHEQVEPVSGEEIDHFAGIELTDRRGQRERSRNIVAEAVAQSRMDESRFYELVFIISHDRQLTQRVNRSVSAELEEERPRREAERETNADGNDEPEDAEDTEDADDESDS